MFDPDAAVAVALVLAKCSPEDWIFDQNFDRSPHTRQNIEELSKYWRVVKILKSCQNINDSSKSIKQIWSVNILSQFFFRKNLPLMVKNHIKILMSIIWFKILTFFLIVYGPFKNNKTISGTDILKEISKLKFRVYVWLMQSWSGIANITIYEFISK